MVIDFKNVLLHLTYKGGNKIKKYLNKKGNSILGVVVILGAVAVIITTALPKIRDAFEIRNIKSIEYFNSTDTLTNIEN